MLDDTARRGRGGCTYHSLEAELAWVLPGRPGSLLDRLGDPAESRERGRTLQVPQRVADLL